MVSDPHTLAMLPTRHQRSVVSPRTSLASRSKGQVSNYTAFAILYKTSPCYALELISSKSHLLAPQTLDAPQGRAEPPFSPASKPRTKVGERFLNPPPITTVPVPPGQLAIQGHQVCFLRHEITFLETSHLEIPLDFQIPMLF